MSLAPCSMTSDRIDMSTVLKAKPSLSQGTVAGLGWLPVIAGLLVLHVPTFG